MSLRDSFYWSALPLSRAPTRSPCRSRYVVKSFFFRFTSLALLIRCVSITLVRYCIAERESATLAMNVRAFAVGINCVPHSHRFARFQWKTWMFPATHAENLRLHIFCTAARTDCASMVWEKERLLVGQGHIS